MYWLPRNDGWCRETKKQKQKKKNKPRRELTEKYNVQIIILVNLRCFGAIVFMLLDVRSITSIAHFLPCQNRLLLILDGTQTSFVSDGISWLFWCLPFFPNRIFYFRFYGNHKITIARQRFFGFLLSSKNWCSFCDNNFWLKFRVQISPGSIL